MDLLTNLALGFSVALQPNFLLMCLIGTLVGTLVGVLPGIGPLATIAMLLPITFTAGKAEVVTELQWYLRPLLPLDASTRARTLAQIPESVRPLILSHLRRWDRASEAERSELLSLDVSHPSWMLGARVKMPAPPPPHPPTWASRAGTHSPDTSPKALARIARLLELDPSERTALLARMSTDERGRAGDLLEALCRLPPGQRTVFINGYRRFWEMKEDDRKRFLRNYESWQAMSAEEKQIWRGMLLGLPPAPPGFRPQAEPSPSSTNALWIEGLHHLWAGV